MSWADDIRCLYCDGRLPLYRKITNGQFCSGAHRKAYWQEQERLAVERLHQTHDSLRAYRPAGSIEEILGEEEAAAENALAAPNALDYAAPEMAGLLKNPVVAMPQWLPDYLAEIDVAPLESGKVLRWPVNARPNRDLSFAAASWAPLVLTAAPGDPAPAGTIEPATLGSRDPRPVHDVRLNLAPQTALPSADEIALANSPIPELAGLTALAMPALRDAMPRASIEVSHTDLAVRAQIPLLAMKLNTALAAADVVEVRIGKFAPIRGRTPVVEREAVAIELRAPAQLQFTFSTPPATPQPRFARGSRYKIETRECAAMLRPVSIETSLSGNSTAEAGTAPQIAEARVALPQMPAMRPKTAKAGASGAVQNTAPAALDPEFEPKPSGLVPLACNARPNSGEPQKRAIASVLLPQPPKSEPSRPVSHLEPIDAKPISDEIPAPDSAHAPLSPHLQGAGKAHFLTHAIDFWNRAPRDLKILAFALPILLGLTLHPSLPKVRASAPAGPAGVERNLQHALDTQWATVKQSVVDRAAVALNEDFRSGLDDWTGRDDATAAWSFDATGFVRPGALALYRPSMELTDYQLQFLGMLDKQALSWVARASDFDNFYVIKLNVLKSGPLPTIGVTRYAVVKGVADARVDTIAPIDARADMLYRVRLDVRGDDFALSVQGQMVDSWSEPRLRRGGVGFFSARGEESRLRWVQVTHQYDMLGRLCAYLAPYNISNPGGNFE